MMTATALFEQYSRYCDFYVEEITQLRIAGADEEADIYQGSLPHWIQLRENARKKVLMGK
jgi:hypothetical protein